MGNLLRMGLQAKLMVLTSFAVVFFVGLFAYLGIHTSTEATRLALEERLGRVKVQALALDEVFQRAVQTLHQVATSQEVNLKDNSLDPERRILRRAYAEGELFSEGLYLFDRWGNLLLAEPESPRRRAFAPEHIKEVLAGGQGPLLHIEASPDGDG
jgi:hypothetical protein